MGCVLGARSFQCTFPGSWPYLLVLCASVPCFQKGGHPKAPRGHSGWYRGQELPGTQPAL